MNKQYGKLRKSWSDSGFTLVEMMVAVVLSMILSLGVGYFIHATLYAAQDVKTIKLIDCAANVFSLLKGDIIDSDSVGVNGAQDTLNLKSATYTISGNQLQRDSLNLLPSWNNGGIYIESGSSFTQGVDADGNGSNSSRENNMAQVTLVLKCMENSVEIMRKTFVFEVLCDANPDGRIK